MEVELEKVKDYLKAFRDSSEPIINTLDLIKAVKLDSQKNDDKKATFHYMKILYDRDLIECIGESQDSNLGFSFISGGKALYINVRLFRMTSLGHQTLEALLQPKLTEGIKKHLGTLGIEALKQIPTLAIQMLTS